jgi:virginiamycin B lyase
MRRPAPTDSPTPASTGSFDVSATPTATIAITPTPGLPGRVPESAAPTSAYAFEEFDVPAGSHPHDVAPAQDGTVWYTAQASGELGRLDPATGVVTEVALGAGSAPHGVIIGPDGAAWVTDGGLNAIVRVDPQSLAATTFPLAIDRNVGLNTAALMAGTLWFTGQAAVYGSVVPTTSSGS